MKVSLDLIQNILLCVTRIKFFRFKFAGYSYRGSSVCSSSGSAGQCQDHAPHQDGGVGVQTDGRIQ